MKPIDAGMPAVVFAQLLQGDALEPQVVSSFRAIMAREGVTDDQLIEQGRQAPLRWFREVYPDLDLDEAAYLGHVCAEQAQLTSFGPLSVPLVSAGSVAEIIELLTYLPLISTALTTQGHPSPDGLLVGLTGRTGDPCLDCLVTVYCGCTLMRLMTMLAVEVMGVTLHCAGPTPRSLSEHDDVRSGRIVFDAPSSFLDVPWSVLDEVCRFSDPVTYRAAIVSLQRELENRGTAWSYTALVQATLEKAEGMPTLSSIATELAMSTSTLKRRLDEEGATYRQLAETVRLARAKLQLLDRSKNITDIALDLGYGDLSNFSHAFKRWTGVSPSDFRRQADHA